MTGLRKDVGWELGVRRTAPAPLEEVWDDLVDEDGLRPGFAASGAVEEVRSRTERRRIRVRWRESGADHVTTLQVSVLSAVRGTTVALHQEHLTGPDERERLLAFWTDRVEAFVGRFPA